MGVVRAESTVATGDLLWRRFAISCVLGAIWISWIGWTLGAYREIFFEQSLSVWAASLAIFFASLMAPGGKRLSWGQRWPLLIPTVWLLCAFFSPTQGDSGYGWWTILSALVVVFGIRQFIRVMLSIMASDFDELPSNRTRAAVAGIVLAIGVGSAALGANNDRFLTCYDFEVSGNAQPLNCRPPAPGFDSQIK